MEALGDEPSPTRIVLGTAARMTCACPRPEERGRRVGREWLELEAVLGRATEVDA